MREKVSDRMIPTPQGGQAPNLQYGGLFRVHVVHRDDESVVLSLLGELDVASMDQFERVVAEVLSGTPKALIFDVTRAEFISAQGYATIGRCGGEVSVQIRSRTHLASRVLRVLGYEGIEVFVAPDPFLDRPG